MLNSREQKMKKNSFLLILCSTCSSTETEGSGSVEIHELPVPVVDCVKRSNCSIENKLGFKVEEYDPICGSDQVNYLNFCDFEKEFCEKNKNIKFENYGLCNSTSECIKAQFESIKLTSEVQSMSNKL